MSADAIRTILGGKLQRVSAHEFKTNIGDTYKAAERAPVAIVKAHKGAGPYQEPITTHVLLSKAHFDAILAALPPNAVREGSL